MYKFEPIYKPKLWGGGKIRPFKGLTPDTTPIGESWELSGVPGSESRVASGSDRGLLLSELLARDGAAILGKANYARFGNQFPLLVKFIDARQDLSIQVHPGDALARERHRAQGKTEMWYVVQADEGASLCSGFARKITPETYESAVREHTIAGLLARTDIRPGDCFFMPAGRVHSIGAGSFIAEIQQTSDITYRIYDFNRRDARGQLRELHTELAKAAIDYTVQEDLRTHYVPQENHPVELVRCDYFVTHLCELTRPLELSLAESDSFVVLVCVGGAATVVDDCGETASLRQGETLLVPASVQRMQLVPEAAATLLMSRIDE